MPDEICRRCGRIHEILDLPELERLKLGGSIIQFLNYSKVKGFHLFRESPLLAPDEHWFLRPSSSSIRPARATEAIDHVLEYVGIDERNLPDEGACSADSNAKGGMA